MITMMIDTEPLRLLDAFSGVQQHLLGQLFPSSSPSALVMFISVFFVNQVQGMQLTTSLN